MGFGRIVAVVASTLLLGGCLPQQAPEVIVPPGVTSTRTADEVGRMMLAEIAANERTLGRPLAQPRIIRIQLLRAGEMYPMRRLDGSNPDGGAMAPSDGPGWMVEAVGTFLGTDDDIGQVVSRGTHGFHLWDDAGGEAMGFFPCWAVDPMPPNEMEGSCP